MAVIYAAFVLSVCLFVCLYLGTARESTHSICASFPFDFLVIFWCVRDMKLVYRNIVRSGTKGSSYGGSRCNLHWSVMCTELLL
jgi:hypothetical protein